MIPSPFASGLTLQGRLPLRWQRLPELPAAEELARLEPANLEVLRLVAALESPALDITEDPAEGSGESLARLDFKLNLLLDLVGQLLARDARVPEPRPLVLVPDGLEWQEVDAPPSTSCLSVELWPSLRYPRPLLLHGQVEASEPDPDGTRIWLRFQGLGRNVRDVLERHIFVAHRREVASRRRQPR